MSGTRRGVLFGLGAAVTFGAATPLAKRLLADTRPQLLAGLLYLGAALVFAVIVPARRHGREARLQRQDLLKLAVLIATGGVLAPVLLLVGLERMSGATGSLLLNLEGPFTLLIGVLVFREHLGRRSMLGAAAVFGAAALIGLGGPSGNADALGALCIAGACALWGLDNNLTQSLAALRDPFSVVGAKVTVAAITNLVVALILGARLPSTGTVVAALGLGVVGYGLSILLDAYALRALGAARESVIFATAPFVGAALALPVLSESLSPADIGGALVMAGGIALMLREQHAHHHAHPPLEHEHLHLHDEHHRHEHEVGVPSTEPHAHRHRHEDLVHSHPHVSDLHHRHPHRQP